VRPSYLKLDRSLIGGIGTDPDRGVLVSAMLGYVRQTGGHPATLSPVRDGAVPSAVTLHDASA
jgi:hypothetical protein